jgi:zinc protease
MKKIVKNCAVLSFLSLIFVVLNSLPVFSQEKMFHAQTARLENGLQIVLIENHRAPIVTHMMWYKVGGADEPLGKSGLAHMFEHLMFKGSKNIPPGEFSKRIRALGGQDNAFTSYDYTAYFQSVSAAHLETVMKMEADRMQDLLVSPTEFEAEKKVVMEERRLRSDNDPAGAFYEQLGYNLFPRHPYGIPLIGWMDEIGALTPEDAIDFYKYWYAPNNAVLVVSGAVTMEELLPLATKYYGPLRRYPALDAPRKRLPPADFKGHIKVVYEHPRVQQAQVIQARRVPSVRMDKVDSYALQILEDILSGGPTTRLYQELVVKQKIASSAGMSVDNNSYDEGRVYLYATPLEGQSLERLQESLEKQIRALISGGVTEQELQDAKDRIEAQAIFARDSVTGPAMVFGQALSSGLTFEDVEYKVHDMKAITTNDIVRVAKRYLDPDAKNALVVTGYLLPASATHTEDTAHAE